MEGNKWTCTACTFENVNIDLNCLVCGNRSPRSCTVAAHAEPQTPKHTSKTPQTPANAKSRAQKEQKGKGKQSTMS